MTEHQQLMWDILRNAPERFVHTAAEDMLSVWQDSDLLHQKADEYFSQIMESYDDVTVIRITKTWLTAYNLPLRPMKMKNFPGFKSHYEKTIAEMSETQSLNGIEYPVEPK